MTWEEATTSYRWHFKVLTCIIWVSTRLETATNARETWRTHVHRGISLLSSRSDVHQVIPWTLLQVFCVISRTDISLRQRMICIWKCLIEDADRDWHGSKPTEKAFRSRPSIPSRISSSLGDASLFTLHPLPPSTPLPSYRRVSVQYLPPTPPIIHDKLALPINSRHSLDSQVIYLW